MHTAHCKSLQCCRSQVMWRCKMRVANWLQAYFHSQKATVSTAYLLAVTTCLAELWHHIILPMAWTTSPLHRSAIQCMAGSGASLGSVVGE